MNFATGNQGWTHHLLWLSICVGCATQSKDHARLSAAAPPEQQATTASAAAPAPAVQEIESATNDATETEVAGDMNSESSNAAAASPRDDAKRRAKATAAATSTTRGAASPAAAAPVLVAPTKSRREEGRGSLDVAPRKPGTPPEFAESPQLHEALAEFELQWERLGTLRACDDACRALESMKRAARRICDLVIASDPRERCLSARARLDQASRDLAARCANCP